MAYFTLPTAGDLKVSAFKRLPNERGGQPRRTLSGELRGDPLWEVRAWEVEVVALTDGEADAIYTDADGFTDRAVSGDLTGAITARVDVIGDGHVMSHERGTWVRTLTLSIREQP